MDIFDDNKMNGQGLRKLPDRSLHLDQHGPLYSGSTELKEHVDGVRIARLFPCHTIASI